MIFVPYKLDIPLYRIPFLTVLVCLACLIIFLSQQKSDTTFETRLIGYCSQGLEPNLGAILRKVNHSGTDIACAQVFMALRNAEKPEPLIAEMASRVHGLDFYSDQKKNLSYISDKIARGFSDFEILVPAQLTEGLQYNPDQHNFLRMISSTFAHGSWGHILGNLFFFFIFASCVECALGPLHFALSFVLMAVTTSLAYSYSVSPTDALPTIGLSGVAMGMMALLTTMAPKAKIWCFFWILLFVRRFTLPVMLIALWYVGWDIYDLRNNDGSSHINYMAHVSGAFTGVALGVLYRIFSAERLEPLTAAAS
jgi:membrane associated rhomboid family serine protease